MSAAAGIELLHADDEGTLILLSVPRRCRCGAVHLLFWNQNGRTGCIACSPATALVRGVEKGNAVRGLNELLTPAIEAYRKGMPVVVFDREKQILHGLDFLENVVAAGKLDPDFGGIDVLVIRDIPREAFESSDWPEALEAARLVFFNRPASFP